MVVTSCVDEADAPPRAACACPADTAILRSSSWVAQPTMRRRISGVILQQLVDADAVLVAGARRRSCSPSPWTNCRLRACPPTLVVERQLLGRSARTARGSAVQMRRTRRWPTTPSDRRGDEERLDAHVEEAVERGDRVGGVQRREHEVAGERGLHGDAGGLDVADLADEDDVGVLAQDRLEAVGEGEAGLLVDLDLVDRREDVLDRVLDRHDVAVGVVDLGERGVERRGLAAAGRAGADHHAERRAHDPRERSRVSSRHAELVRAGRAAGSCRAAAARTFSPQIVAVVATRTSSARPSTSMLNWPSCGRRRSTMFMSAMILMRLTSGGGHRRRAASSTSWSAPSMRKRTRSRSSCGSMCTSDARSRSACVRIRLTTCTTGASSSTACWAVDVDLAARGVGGLERLHQAGRCRPAPGSCR